MGEAKLIQATRKLYEARGFYVERTTWLRKWGGKWDLFGFADVMCVRPQGMALPPGALTYDPRAVPMRSARRLLVQVTSGGKGKQGGHHADRRQKILDSPALPIVLGSGFEVWVVSWRQGASGELEPREEQITEVANGQATA